MNINGLLINYQLHFAGDSNLTFKSDHYLHTTRKRHPNNNALLVMAISSGTVEYKRQSSLEMDSKTLM